jgi:hypothetical protein
VKQGVEGGAGSSLKSEQKRTLHVHTEALLRDDGLKEAQVRLLRPIGSTFKFVSDENLRAGAKAVDTHLFVRLDGAGDSAQKLLKMGEQTCFLHASMRTINRTRLGAEIGGAQVEIETADTP